MEDICIVGEKILVNMYNGKLENHLTLYVIKYSAKRWRPVCQIQNHKVTNSCCGEKITVYVFSIRFSNGRTLMEKLD